MLLQPLRNIQIVSLWLTCFCKLFLERNIYLGKFLYFLKTRFALHHKHKDNTTVTLEK